MLLIILELFSGTKSVGKVAKKRGYKVISIDIEKKFKPSIVTDILKLDFKKLPTPNFIWASPPCNTFSNLVRCHKHPTRNIKPPYNALNDKGKMGDKILNKTLEIIKHFSSLNDKLKFVIENPKGMMRFQKQMKGFFRNTTTYCKYGDKRKKATDFFSNFDIDLKPVCTPSAPHGFEKHAFFGRLSLTDRYKIPSKLITEIFNQANLKKEKKNIKKKERKLTI